MMADPVRLRMDQLWGKLLAGVLAGLFASIAGNVQAEVIVATDGAQVIEVLPAVAGGRGDERRLRQLLAARPGDARLAVLLARRQLDRARTAGDPRFAGLALSALNHWPATASASAPPEVLLLRATIQQFLHQFDAARATLQPLLARADGARLPQVWLTLATILRVQGRYTESDQACSMVAQAGADGYAHACLAENAGLRGDLVRARADLHRLLVDPATPPQTQGWLLTSLAELEQRAGHTSAADAAFRRALRAEPDDAYAMVAYADFLIDQGRPGAALAVLRGAERTDAVLLRLAIAGTQAGAAGAPVDVNELRERIALANQRPDAQIFHGREQAMFALAVDHAPVRALALARGDVAQQREAIDLLVFARAAVATGDRAAIDDARRLKKYVGLYDRRIDAVL
jgi:uncharacterized protein (TIGR02996 family)